MLASFFFGVYMIKQMLFNKTYQLTDGTIFESGKVYPIEEDTGSVARWLRRGCQIVEEKVEEKVVEKVAEIIEEKVEVKPIEVAPRKTFGRRVKK